MRSTSAIAATAAVLAAPTAAMDVTENFSFGGRVAGAMQCQVLQDDAGADDECQGAMPIRPEISLRPDEDSEFFLLLAFAVGNGLNSNDDRNRSPFALTTWSADLEDDVEDINGRDRDHLMEGWYKHTLRFEESTLGVTVGIIDSTGYVDQNVYANDEYTQFMNEIFVNNNSALFPSNDGGVVLEWERERWSVNALGMSIGKNDNDNEFLYFATQLGYAAETRWGPGNYRITLGTTNGRFLDEDGTGDDARRSEVVLNFDQAFGTHWGGFARLGWQDDDATVLYEAVFSGGVDVRGGLWGREYDNVAVGLAYMDGGNEGIDDSVAVEAYYRAVLTERLALTADLQWLRDDSQLGGDADAQGWVLGLRAVAEF